jgi:hypothetical protein
MATSVAVSQACSAIMMSIGRAAKLRTSPVAKCSAPPSAHCPGAKPSVAAASLHSVVRSSRSSTPVTSGTRPAARSM